MKKILLLMCAILGFSGILLNFSDRNHAQQVVFAEENSKLPEKYKTKQLSDDVTGDWRVVQAKKNFDPQVHPLQYYEKYFKDDKEIHFIVNRSEQTVTQINSFGVFLDVTVKEYTKNEERSAKTLARGDVIEEYHIDTETGEFEQII